VCLRSRHGLAYGRLEVLATKRAERPSLRRQHEEVPGAVVGFAPAIEQVAVGKASMLWGAQTRSSGRKAVFVDESAESICSSKLL
jgi:hypothetical protein